jgi:hypothetical protein
MDPAAQDDPEGFDNYRTMEKVGYLADLLNARFAQTSEAPAVPFDPVAAPIVLPDAADEDLAMMIRMLVSSLKRHWPHAPHPSDLPSRAIDLLRRKGLMGSPLREDMPLPPAPSTADRPPHSATGSDSGG